MRIIECQQGSEAWERLRARPTASEFHKFVTPVRGEYSTQAGEYAAKIIAKQLGVYEESLPTYWMTRGVELEPSAKAAYTRMTGREITSVGFVIPDETDSFGCSPDGLVGDDGGFEGKCPKPETLIKYHAGGVLPIEYKVQVQATLFITKRNWWEFFAFHPELNPFLIRVEPDLEFHAKIAECLLTLLQQIKLLGSKVKRMNHEIVSLEETTVPKLRFADE